ncbi:MAG TPA: hypothetical protein VL460_05230 [Caulobacteraceae bacterium]|jgi:hypothetical protein|nr:hypothetical protein [Caulobacteraceae bacterium]
MWRRRGIRGRDIRAISFCLVSIAAVFAATYFVADHLGFDVWLPTLAATGAYAAWLLTRPRMVRVFRRLRGQSIAEWTGYFEN